MALDAQSNWNIEMSQPLKIPRRSVEEKPDSSSSSSSSMPWFSDTAREVLLPAEIISQIMAFIPKRASSQPTYWACTLVSRAWYSAAIALLYERPYLGGGNFNEFVSTVCPSKNAHIIKSSLATLIRRLDMGELVHNASRSLTARLLSRVKGNIEEFVAPQTSFSINSLAALSKCAKLRYLNLVLISASIPNKILFQTLQSLKDLETLFLPRSSYNSDKTDSQVRFSWPPRLKALHLAGGAIDGHFLSSHVGNVPASVTNLSIQHCPQNLTLGLSNTLQEIGPQLRQLTIRHPIQHLWRGSLDRVLEFCPLLTALRISADFITDDLFSHRCALQILDLECSPTAEPDVEITANAIYDAVDKDLLPDLRSVRVSARLAWDATPQSRTDAKDLSDLLQAMETEQPLDVMAGVWWNMPD